MMNERMNQSLVRIKTFFETLRIREAMVCVCETNPPGIVSNVGVFIIPISYMQATGFREVKQLA